MSLRSKVARRRDVYLEEAFVADVAVREHR